MILVTGATGFTGEFVVRQFVERGERPACFVRWSSDVRFLEELGTELRRGDLADVEAFTAALRGIETLVNVASLGLGHAHAILEACQRAGVRRAVFVSTTAIFTRLAARSRAMRVDAERLVMSSGLDYTIVRPTMIYGTERDRNMCRLVKFMARSPVVPVVGRGMHLQQPIHVEDLATVIVEAVGRRQAVRRSYNVAGLAPLTFNEVIDATARALGRRIRRFHLPLAPIVKLMALYERLVPHPRLRAEQLLRLEEDKAFAYDAAAADLGFAPRSFDNGIRQEVARLRARAVI